MGQFTHLHGMVEGQDARALADLVRAHGRVLHIAADDVRVQTLATLMAFFAPDVRVMIFPAWDCLPYDRVSPSADISAARMATLAGLTQFESQTTKRPTLILTSLAAAMQRVVPPDILRTHHVHLVPQGRMDLVHTEQFLVQNGYARTDTVREAGEFSVRGGIIDIFPAGTPEPLRIDLFGDVIESIRWFDPVTQRSGEKAEKVLILPATEYGLDEASIARFRSGYRDAFGVPRLDDPLYTAISEGRRHSGAEHWLPLFYDQMATLFDYVPGAMVSLDPHTGQNVTDRSAQVLDYYEQRQSFLKAYLARKVHDHQGALYYPLSVSQLYISDSEWAGLMAERDITTMHIFRGAQGTQDEEEPLATRARDFSDVRAQPKADLFSAVLTHLISLQGGRRVVIACYSVGARERMKTLLMDAGMKNPALCDDMHAVMVMHPAQIGLIVLPLEHGFTAPDLAVITEQDILGDRLVRRPPKKRKAEHFIQDISVLKAGDLVVHIDHGIGRFEGLETISVGGATYDCLKLIYDGGDRLFLPAQNMELISRFGGEDSSVQLDKLGGAGWQARKARVKKDLMEMADDLLEIAAARLLRGADGYTPDAHGYQEFAARFPYQETEDQQNAIDDVLGDLARGTAADRLVCGDVGFGKTEIALRAAYVVAASGAQVAVVVPTTLLARQHVANFNKRFEGMGIRVGHLSRMAHAPERKATKQGLADGSVQIVVGTHAVLAKDVKFAHLGLVIVDEEQRFGVKQKEALKAIKNNVHVLTLTATPIPRTLQMALSGVRDMSIIASPPIDRLAIRTSVLPFDPMVVREAILRERHRGGQTFYVCPRIADLKDVEDTLRDLVPEVRVVVAHGALAAGELEDRMGAFYDGQYDVLLATNIIESGIDIPSANTMIVHRADMFGLAQLYQIRGRIGRAKTRAYAYLTYDPHAKLSADARKRLEVIEQLDTLGSGFQLASHDMDIRGAGNLLGDDQSGHVREVGVELYQHMLEEAVVAARTRVGEVGDMATDESWTPSINIGISVYIPECYVTDLTSRMSLYRRLSDLHDKSDIESFAAEMIDRFGPLPPEVENLLVVVELKELCRAGGVDRVEAGPKGAVIGFRNDSPPVPEALFTWLAAKKGTVKVRPDQKLTAVREWTDPAHRLKGVRSLLKELAEMA